MEETAKAPRRGFRRAFGVARTRAVCSVALLWACYVANFESDPSSIFWGAQEFFSDHAEVFFKRDASARRCVFCRTFCPTKKQGDDPVARRRSSNHILINDEAPGVAESAARSRVPSLSLVSAGIWPSKKMVALQRHGDLFLLQENHAMD